MKSFFVSISAIVLLLVSVQHARAEIAVSNVLQKVSFDLELTETANIKNTNKTIFTFNAKNIKNSTAINSWSIVLYCPQYISVSVNKGIGNDCGKEIILPKTVSPSFYLLFESQNRRPAEFFFRMKALDVNGRRLDVEKQNFNWK